MEYQCSEVSSKQTTKKYSVFMASTWVTLPTIHKGLLKNSISFITVIKKHQNNLANNHNHLEGGITTMTCKNNGYNHQLAYTQLSRFFMHQVVDQDVRYIKRLMEEIRHQDIGRAQLKRPNKNIIVATQDTQGCTKQRHYLLHRLLVDVYIAIDVLIQLH